MGLYRSWRLMVSLFGVISIAIASLGGPAQATPTTQAARRAAAKRRQREQLGRQRARFKLARKHVRANERLILPLRSLRALAAARWATLVTVEPRQRVVMATDKRVERKLRSAFVVFGGRRYDLPIPRPSDWTIVMDWEAVFAAHADRHRGREIVIMVRHYHHPVPRMENHVFAWNAGRRRFVLHGGATRLLRGVRSERDARRVLRRALTAKGGR
jgi:hypothetical protein